LFARRVAEASTILAVFGTLVGCSESGEQKEYDTPSALCNVPVDRDLVSSLLPPGKKISIQEKNPVPSRSRCQVDVDGKVALIASQEWWGKEESINDVADAHPQLESAELTDDNALLFTGTGAVERVKSCVDPNHPDHVLYTAIQVYTSAQEDASSVRKLISEYTKEVELSSKCR
jgi:hypothetical protein